MWVPGTPAQHYGLGAPCSARGVQAHIDPSPSLKSGLGKPPSRAAPRDPDTDHLHQEQLMHGSRRGTPTNKPWSVPCPFWTLRPTSSQINLPVYKHKLEPASPRHKPLHQCEQPPGLSHLHRGRGRRAGSQFAAVRLAAWGPLGGRPASARLDRASRNFTSANLGETENQQGRLKTLIKG